MNTLNDSKMLRQAKAFSGFSVDDLEAAKAFYEDTLGLEVVTLDMGLLQLSLAGGNHVIVYPKPDHAPATFTILNFPVGDIEATVDGLMAKGVTFEQYPEPIKTNEKGICRNDMGPAIAWFKDPAGNILAVLEDM